MRVVICLQIPTIFPIGGRTAFLRYWMCIMSVMLGRYKYIRVNHQYMVPVVLRFKSILQSWKRINRRVVIKFRQNWSRQEAKYYCLRSINSLNIFGIRKNCLINVLCQSSKKGDKTECNSYRGISLLSTSYKMLSTILLSSLNPYIDEIIGDHQCGFWRNRSTTD
jgi:hypothetical protein